MGRQLGSPLQELVRAEAQGEDAGQRGRGRSQGQGPGGFECRLHMGTHVNSKRYKT